MERALAGKQVQGFHVIRPQDAEVLRIEGCELRLIQPLHDGQHRRVHQTEFEVSVALQDVAATGIVGSSQRDNGVSAGENVVKQDEGPLVYATRGTQPVELDDDRRGQNEFLIGRSQQLPATSVIIVAAIVRSKQRPRIDD